MRRPNRLASSGAETLPPAPIDQLQHVTEPRLSGSQGIGSGEYPVHTQERRQGGVRDAAVPIEDRPPLAGGKREGEAQEGGTRDRAR